MSDSIHVVGFSGSLRQGSYNAAALRAAQTLLPEGMTLEILDLAPIPLFHGDPKGEVPAAVQHFKARIAAADALLIATPEYNFSVPGVLKNALDWASLPDAQHPKQPLNDKPLALLGASTGALGSARAQYHLRQIAVWTNMHPLNKPEVFIMRAAEKFDAEGTLTDAPTRQFVGDLLTALAAWARRLRAGSPS